MCISVNYEIHPDKSEYSHKVFLDILHKKSSVFVPSSQISPHGGNRKIQMRHKIAFPSLTYWDETEGGGSSDGVAEKAGVGWTEMFDYISNKILTYLCAYFVKLKAKFCGGIKFNLDKAPSIPVGCKYCKYLGHHSHYWDCIML